MLWWVCLISSPLTLWRWEVHFIVNCFQKNIHQFVFLATIQDLMNRFCLKHIWSTKGMKGWQWRWRGLMLYQGSNSNLKLILLRFLKEHCFFTEVDVEILQALVAVKFMPMPNQMSTTTNSKSSVIHYASDHWRIWQILQKHQTVKNLSITKLLKTKKSRAFVRSFQKRKSQMITGSKIKAMKRNKNKRNWYYVGAT